MLYLCYFKSKSMGFIFIALYLIYVRSIKTQHSISIGVGSERYTVTTLGKKRTKNNLRHPILSTGHQN